MKLNPPYLNNKLPAFTKEDKKITIPFQLNRSVNINDISEYQLTIKDAHTDESKSTLYTENSAILIEDKEYKIDFDITDETLKEYIIGNFYKVQLSFASSNGTITETGYASNAGIIKCIEKPSVIIQNLNSEANNAASRVYVGKYSINDVTEKVAEYCFEILDDKGIIYETSNWQIHNTQLDTSSKESVDTWNSEKELESGKKYIIIYKVKTINNYETQTEPYTIINQLGVNFDVNLELHSKLDRDNGYVNLFITCGSPLSGKYLITRASSLDNYTTWNQIADFEAAAANEEQLKWKDNTIEHGIKYLYAIQAYNDNNIYSKRQNAIEGIIQAEFEDMFLSDGERYLKVKFNPTVSSFKSTVLEQKTDTLGSKFPFFYRNGSVGYKEFSISGLISVLMENEIDQEEIRTRTKGISLNKKLFDKNKTNLIDDNIYKERKFKMSVLEWLNNGKPKLFRSPTEGSYIVRLMNISLTPNDTLGRMLHTFQSIAYEIADNNWNNIIKNKIYFNKKEEKYSYKFISDKIENRFIINNNSNIKEINFINFYNVPNATIGIKYLNNDQIINYNVGPSGIYSLNNIINIQIIYINNYNESSWYEMSYRENTFADFDKITKVIYEDALTQIQNFEGELKLDVLKELGEVGYIYYLKANYDPVIPEGDPDAGIIIINGESISLINRELVLKDLEQLNELLIGFGVTVDIAYQKINIEREGSDLT